jgi:hypothetical protein
MKRFLLFLTAALTFVPSLSQAYVKELLCIPALSTKLRRFQRKSKPFRPSEVIFPLAS